jgi:hypothetical protein
MLMVMKEEEEEEEIEQEEEKDKEEKKEEETLLLSCAFPTCWVPEVLQGQGCLASHTFSAGMTSCLEPIACSFTFALLSLRASASYVPLPVPVPLWLDITFYLLILPAST